jgi:transposase
MSQTKTVYFSKQVFHVGIDTHKSNWKVTIRSNGIHLKTFSMNPSPQELHTYMNRRYPGGTYASVYEAGFCGYWIHRDLSQLGFRNIIVNPVDIPTTHKEKDRKCDGIDSHKLSRELEHHSLTGIYIPTATQESLRSLSRLWLQYSRRGAQIKNRIKGFLSFTGVLLPKEYEHAHWSKNYIVMLSTLSFETDVNRYILDTHIEELNYVRTKRLALLAQIRKLSRDVPTIRYLRTIPGIGQIIGFLLYAELIDIRRFKHTDELMSFIGLVPSLASSDTKEYVRGITQRHNRVLRRMLIEASWIAVRKDPALTIAFSQYTKRMTKGRAIVRIAKKLTNRIRSVWLQQKPYVFEVVE